MFSGCSVLVKIEWGVLKGGGSCNSRFVLKPDVAIASEVSFSRKDSLAITDFLAQTTQLASHFSWITVGRTRITRTLKLFWN